MIRKFDKILSALSSGQKINVKKFSKLCKETADLYVSLYDWYHMPVTIHKILMHGPEIIKSFILPVGLYAEDAQETRTKDLRRFRLNHTRKIGRIESNTDLLIRLILSSDPYIKYLGGGRSKKTIDFDPEVLDLLIIDPAQFDNLEEETQDYDPDYVVRD